MEPVIPNAPSTAPAPTPAAAPVDPQRIVEALKQHFAAELASRDAQHRAELEALRQSAAADLAARDLQHAAQLREFQQRYVAESETRNGQLQSLQQALHDMHAQLTAVAEARNNEAEDRAAAETELQARRAQLAAQHLELETHRAQLAQLGAQVAELTQALAAEHQSAVQWNDRAQRLEATLREFAGRAHDATAEAAAVIADAHEAAVKRGDEIAEQVGYHEAAVNQLRATIESQREAYERVLEERQAARARCVELESQLHSLTADARHLAEGLQRVQAEREAERRAREQHDAVPASPPRLRLASSAEGA